MKLCVAYCRVSTNKEDQKNSLEAQKRYYTDLFEKKGYNPASVGMLYKKGGKKEVTLGIFADEGISGTSLKNRQAFNAMMEYAKKKAFDIIYVKSVSRFSRSTVDGINMIKNLRALGVAVIFEDCGINTLTDIKKDFEIELRLSLANDESRKKSENIKWGMLRLYERGGWSGLPPYGYDIEKSYLKINDNEAKTVMKIFSLYVNEGYGTYKIARYLNLNDILTKKGVKWSQKQISDILKNSIYTGKKNLHLTETIDVNLKIRNKVDKSKQIPMNFNHLRIVSDELFSLAQLELQKRHEMHSCHTGHSNKHLLSSLLYCGHCGGNYKRKKRHSYRRKDGTQLDIGYEWTCAINDMYGKSRCSHRNAVIETEIIDQVKQKIVELRDGRMDSLFELYLLVNFNYDISKSHYEDLIKQKDKKSKEMQALRSDLVDGLIEREIYKEQMKELNKIAVEINDEIVRIEKHEVDLQYARLKYKQYMDYVKNIDLDNLTNAGLKKIFKSIEIEDIKLNNCKKIICPVFNYYCLDMSENEIIEKADKMGINFKYRVLL